ncbi:MAG: hypothetical protein IJH75_07865, partial [Mogibacterium sp.]|nr:hypothetical protein [Mogibacterium sp.]
MDVLSLLTGLRQAALRNPELRRALLATAQSARSLKDFCRIARASGFEFYEMDLRSAGEDLDAVMKRLVNGG